jgi:hypothetical protein
VVSDAVGKIGTKGYVGGEEGQKLKQAIEKTRTQEPESLRVSHARTKGTDQGNSASSEC